MVKLIVPDKLFAVYPVQLVNKPDVGVPSAGVTSDGPTLSTVLP